MSRKKKILVCRGPDCGMEGAAQEIYECFRRELAARRLDEEVELSWQSCFGRCRQGPNALICEVDDSQGPAGLVFGSPLSRRGPSALYNRLQPRDVVELIEEHVLRGRFVRRLIRPPAMPERSEPKVGATLAAAGRPPSTPEDGDS